MGYTVQTGGERGKKSKDRIESRYDDGRWGNERCEKDYIKKARQGPRLGFRREYIRVVTRDRIVRELEKEKCMAKLNKHKKERKGGRELVMQ